MAGSLALYPDACLLAPTDVTGLLNATGMTGPLVTSLLDRTGVHVTGLLDTTGVTVAIEDGPAGVGGVVSNGYC